VDWAGQWAGQWAMGWEIRLYKPTLININQFQSKSTPCSGKLVNGNIASGNLAVAKVVNDNGKQVSENHFGKKTAYWQAGGWKFA
jgi:hypothetical protein